MEGVCIGDIFDRCALEGQVYGSCNNPVKFFVEHTLDICSAVRTGHAGNAKIGFGIAYIETGFFYLIGNIVQC